MASADRYTDSDDEPRAKRRKGPKACDVCRRKKIRCDPDPSGDPTHPCLNCAVFKTECTYTYIAKKRRTQQAHIDGLQARLHKLESLLTSLAPDVDLSKLLEADAPVPDLPARVAPTRTNRTPPLAQSPTSSTLPSAFTDWREPAPASPPSDDDSDSDSSGNGAFLPYPAASTTGTAPHRFHGKSSGVLLLHKVMGLKRTQTGSGLPLDTSLLPWEAQVYPSLTPRVSFNFPPPDLQTHLLDVYFTCIHPFAPLVHRPTLEANVAAGLHTRDAPFGAALLLLFAAAARFSSDPRVLSTTHPDPDGWSSAGWDYYFEVQMRYRRNILHTTSVYDLQMIALACIYLQGTFNPSPAWHMAGLGLRLALDVGAHRRKMPDAGDKLESEIWKRAFWVLVVLDRLGSVYLGRPCALWEEDIDIDLPLEVDDEYLNLESSFTQPEGRPSYVVYFNTLAKLSQVLVGALRTIYPISKSKSMFRLLGPRWEQDMVASLDSQLNSWLEGVPEQLRWDPTRPTIDTPWYQSAMIHALYHHVQIVVHRPYITKPRSAFPALAICTHAARACAHILAVLRKRGTLFIPLLNHAAFASAIVLLFNIWGRKGGGGVEGMVEDVHSCMRFIEKTKSRWQVSQRMWTILQDLVSVGEIPLPQCAPSPPFSGHKRTRDEEDTTNTPHTSTATTTASTPLMRSDTTAQNYILDGMQFTTGTTGTGDMQSPFCVYNPAQAQTQAPGGYYPRSADPLSSSPPAPAPPLQQQQQSYAHPGDVLTALDSAYFVDSAAGSSLGDGVVMDVAQHAMDVWGTAPAGFQWDEWQQFASAVQSGPSGLFTQVPLEEQGVQ